MHSGAGLCYTRDLSCTDRSRDLPPEPRDGIRTQVAYASHTCAKWIESIWRDFEGMLQLVGSDGEEVRAHPRLRFETRQYPTLDLEQLVHTVQQSPGEGRGPPHSTQCTATRGPLTSRFSHRRRSPQAMHRRSAGSATGLRRIMPLLVSRRDCRCPRVSLAEIAGRP